MVQINWTKQALDDFRILYEYISNDSATYARLQILKIKQRTDMLKAHPLAGHMVPEIELKEIRQLIEGRYRIVYRLVSIDRIDILTVHHSSRGFEDKKFDITK